MIGFKFITKNSLIFSFFPLDDYRLLMRRDNVYKIICNQKVTEHLQFKEQTLQSFIWGCKDFSENPNGDDQIFVIKFKVLTSHCSFLNLKN